MLAGLVLLVAPWYEAARWQTSPEAARAVRNGEAPTPVWLTPTPETQVALHLASVQAPPPPRLPAAAPTPEPKLSAPVVLTAQVDVAPSPTPSASDLTLGATTFAFDDPPEPGAHAHLTVEIHNPTDFVSGPVTLRLVSTWLAGYRLEQADPSPQSGIQTDGVLRISFDGPAPRSEVEVSLGFVTTDEVIDSPDLSVFDAQGRKIGDAHPPTEAPKPRPGPIYSVDIPRLRLHTGVVPVDWEPPLFVVGQLRTSAYVTRGNSVLVGHVRGAAGYNVFDHLDQLQPGDEVIANSRGAAYDFVVTRTEVLPEDDTSPVDSSVAPRLTLMTCAGDWNPVTRDYADRLWVIAEPM
jgi:LPXTG-site transpeptidase (sortase) family protein